MTLALFIQIINNFFSFSDSETNKTKNVNRKGSSQPKGVKRKKDSMTATTTNNSELSKETNDSTANNGSVSVKNEKKLVNSSNVCNGNVNVNVNESSPSSTPGDSNGSMTFSEQNGGGSDTGGSTCGDKSKKKKARTTFTGRQIFELEKQFEVKKYLSSSERSEMAKLLNVTETQVSLMNGINMT